MRIINAESHYIVCFVLIGIRLSVIILKFNMLNVNTLYDILMSVIMLSAMQNVILMSVIM
jgi:hypothetical protein